MQEGALCVGDSGGDGGLLLFVRDGVGDGEEDGELVAGELGLSPAQTGGRLDP